MENLQKTEIKPVNIWRVRTLAVCYLTALIVVVAPVTPLHQPPIESAEGLIVQPTPKQFAAYTAKSIYGWDTKQISCLNKLWGKESAWNHKADNPHSTAFGIAQMLGETATDPETQIYNGLRYIEHRYNTPCNAWSFWGRNSYY